MIQKKSNSEVYGAEYNVWSNMIQRCTNPNNRAYHDYGGHLGLFSDPKEAALARDRATLALGFNPNHGR